VSQDRESWRELVNAVTRTNVTLVRVRVTIVVVEEQ